MLTTFSFGVSSNLSQQKGKTAKIIGMYFLRTIIPRKYVPIISAVGLFCCDKFEETPNEKVSKLSKLSKSYFKTATTGTNLYVPSWKKFKSVFLEKSILIVLILRSLSNTYVRSGSRNWLD